jgi:hypothetical protein
MRPEGQKNRTGIGPHLRRPRAAEKRVISVVEVGYVRRSEFTKAENALSSDSHEEALCIVFGSDAINAVRICTNFASAQFSMLLLVLFFHSFH